MSLQELRAQIIEDVQAVNDEKALQEVLDTLHGFPPFVGGEEELVQLQPQQLTELQRRLEEAKAGKFLTEEEADKQIATWLDAD